MRNTLGFVLGLLLALGCGKSSDPKADPESAAATPGPASAKPQADERLAEAVKATKADIAEVRAGIAAGSRAEFLVCNDIMARMKEVEQGDQAIAAEADKLCTYELPLAEIKLALTAIEAEVAETAAKPNPHKLERQIGTCFTENPTKHREKLEQAGKLDDVAKQLFARYAELCPGK